MADTPAPSPITQAGTAAGSTFVGLAVFKFVRRLIDVKWPGFLDIDATEGLETISITVFTFFSTYIMPRWLAKLSPKP